MRTAPSPVLLALLGLLGGGCAGVSYLRYRIAPDYPRDRTETVALTGLSRAVRVHLDAFGIPHVDARDEADLLRAIGFLHGRSRFFQMDVLRRYARGRLSELVGEQQIPQGNTVELDATLRAWGLEDGCREDAASLDPHARTLLAAYAEGVNAALARYRPIEYRLLRVQPEPWTLPDTFAVSRLIAWALSHNWLEETSRLLLALEGGLDRADAIYPFSGCPGTPSLAPATEPRPLPPAVAPELRGLFPPRPYQPPPRGHEQVSRVLAPSASASNAWVLGGGRTASGKPLLANDPHLTHLLPSLLFQQHLRCPGLDAIGVTIPGIPYVLAGRNRSVIWGLTSAVADAADLYIERQPPNGLDTVLGPSGPERLVREQLIIRVRAGSTFRERRFPLRRTPRGPLLNDIYPGLLPDGAPLVSVRWDTAGAGQSIPGLGRANRARSVAELREAILDVAPPTLVVTAADTSGTIALFPVGRVPVRPHHLGTFPAPAWLPAYAWAGRAAPGQMPFAAASGAACFIHANNPLSDPARSPVPFQADAGASYRRDRIAELLDATPRHTLQTTARIQLDCFLGRARRLAPILVQDIQALQGKTPREEAALRLLAHWDYQGAADSPAPAIFFATYREAILAALQDELTPKGLQLALSEPYFPGVADLWFLAPDHAVWDDRATPQAETRRDIVQAAFRRAVASLRRQQGRDPAAWRWGKLHELQPAHLFGSKAFLAGFFNLPNAPAPGALDSVWKTHFDLSRSESPFRVTAGPVCRMIIDLGAPGRAAWILDTGASGWPGSPHYGDQHRLWRNGEYIPMVMDWDELRVTSPALLTLSPP
jgi:penicillin amidase